LGRGDVAQAAAREEPAVQTFRAAGDGRWLTYGLILLARVRIAQDRPAEARTLLEQARPVWRRAETTHGQPFDAYLRYWLGVAELAEGDTDAARADLQASLGALDAGDDWARALVLGGLGLLAARQGQHTEARARFAGSLPPLRRGGDQWNLALALLNAGLEETGAASPAARSLLVEALRAWQRVGGRAGVALALAGLWQVAAGRGAPRRAGQLFGAGRALLPATDPLLRDVVPYDLSAQLAAARGRGDPAAFDRGLAEGSAWTIDTAVAEGVASTATPA
jgi:tetratricopeptide (TPR) repeat protein